MKNYLVVALVVSLVFTLTACGKDNGVIEKQTGSPFEQSTTGQAGPVVSGSWQESVLKAPKIAELEYKGTTHEVRIHDGQKYIINLSTSEIVSGTHTGDATATVLKDWVEPYGTAVLEPEDSLFKDTWSYTSERVRGLIGYCDASYTLVTRARTADYIEYIYKDKTSETHYRIAVTDDYIMYAPLIFSYVFDVNAY